MKKTLIVAAIIGSFSIAVQAQTVTIYGVVDAGVMGITNSGNINNNFIVGACPVPGCQEARVGTAVGLMSGGQSMDRFGFKGNEDIGGGIRAFFQLESGFNIGSGALANSGLAGNGAGSTVHGAQVTTSGDTSLEGQLFNRLAFVGLGTTVGDFSFGRHNALFTDIIGTKDYDPVNALMFSPINFSGSYGGGGATDDSRIDNSVKYALKSGKFNFDFLYGFGEVAGSKSARSTTQAGVGYEDGALGIQFGMQRTNDASSMSGNVLPNTVNVTWENTVGYLLAAKYTFTNGLTLKGGYEREEISTPNNLALDETLTSIYGYSIGKSSGFTGATKNINVSFVGLNYDFTPVVKGSFAYYNIDVPAYGTTLSSGNQRYLSAMLEYSMSKRTNLYAAFMLGQYNGNQMVTAGANTLGSTESLPVTGSNIFGAGVRVKF